MFKWQLEKQYIEEDFIDEVWVKMEDGKLVKIKAEREDADDSEEGQQG